MLDNMWMGDCRQREVLERAQVQRYRAVLLVTSNERVNIDAAFAIRLLNPNARLVVRSAKQTLNELLEERLGNFVAFEATQLPTTAFAIAALGDENQGFIEIDDSLLRVVKRKIAPSNKWWDRRVLHELNTNARRVLSHNRANEPPDQGFYDWHPDDRLRVGDTITCLEVDDRLSFGDRYARQATATPQADPNHKSWWHALLSPASWRTKMRDIWLASAEQPSKRVALVVGLTVLFLLLLGMALLMGTGRLSNPLEAFYASLMLLLGSYDALLDLRAPGPTPLWLQLMHLSYTLAGTASIAVLYALLTEYLLATKFQLPKKRPPIPRQNHIVVVGLGRVGRGVAQFLQKLNQPLVGICQDPLESTVLPELPLMVGDLATGLKRVNIESARGVVICTPDEIANLELGMTAHTASPRSNLVIRTFDPTFSDNVDRLLPYAHVYCAYALAAEVYVAAAFGENVLTLLRLDNRTIIVTDYTVEVGDTLEGLLLSEVAYGYGVVPVSHRRKEDETPTLLPSDDRLLAEGDRLLVLASSDSLQRIERGDRLPPNYAVRVDHCNSPSAQFDATRAIVRITNMDGAIVNDTMQNLPAIIPKRLYRHQAIRLVRALSKTMTTARVLEAKNSSPNR